MAKFDVYRLRRNDRLVLNCQADLLDDLRTRFVVPLLIEPEAPRAIGRLNPILVVEGRRLVMVPQLAATLATRELGDRVASLRDEQDGIGQALDMLINGF